MSTSVDLNDQLVADAANLATRIGRTVTEVIEDALREKLTKSGAITAPVELVRYGKGGPMPGVDLSSLSALYDAMESDRDPS